MFRSFFLISQKSKKENKLESIVNHYFMQIDFDIWKHNLSLSYWERDIQLIWTLNTAYLYTVHNMDSNKQINT